MGGALGYFWLNPWGSVGLAFAALAARELVQFIDNGKPHLLDRLRDSVEGGLGGLTAWVLWTVLT